VPTYPAGVIGAPPHVGPITRSVRDAAALLRVLARPDDRDPYRLPHDELLLDWESPALTGLRIGYSARLFPAELSPELSAAFARAVEVFRQLGASLSPVEDRLESPAPILTTLFHARAAFTVKDLSAEQRALLDPAIEEAAREGEALSLQDYLSAEAERTALAQRLAAVHRHFDLLLTPSTGELAPKVDARPSALRAPFTGAFSLTRQPAISLPNGQGQAGLPIGVQLVGRHFEEATILRAAAAFETRVSFVAPNGSSNNKSDGSRTLLQ
jgi:aspartyl-tRNA(Asn)/glutamyl-tRNA(Gln) amidotransferase subunit A